MTDDYCQYYERENGCTYRFVPGDRAMLPCERDPGKYDCPISDYTREVNQERLVRLAGIAKNLRLDGWR